MTWLTEKYSHKNDAVSLSRLQFEKRFFFNVIRFSHLINNVKFASYNRIRTASVQLATGCYNFSLFSSNAITVGKTEHFLAVGPGPERTMSGMQFQETDVLLWKL